LQVRKRLRTPQHLGASQREQELLRPVEAAHAHRSGADALKHVRVGARAGGEVVLARKAHGLVVVCLEEQPRVVDLEHVDLREVPV
jgi:hypothetical protein